MAAPDLAVVISALRSFELYERVKGQIKPKWFPTLEIRNIYEKIKESHENHPGRLIPWKDLRVLLKGQKGFDKVLQLEKRAEGTSQLIRQQTLSRFLEVQTLEELTQDMAHAHDNGTRIDHGEYIRRLETAQRAGCLVAERRNIFTEESKQWIQKIETVPVIPLPSVELTAAMRGGIAGGRPTTLLTRTDGGKTSFAVACGAHAVKKGFRVAHFSFEDSADEIFRRYSCSFCRETWDWVSKHPKNTNLRLSKIKEAGGDLEVVDFSSVSATTADIQMEAARINRLWGGIDFFIIDAGDDVKSLTKSELATEIIGEVWRFFTQLSRKYKDAPVLVTTQTNRVGAMARTIDMFHVGEGWKKATVSSAILVFNVPKDSKRGSISIVKTKRKGYYPTIPVYFDRERCIVQ